MDLISELPEHIVHRVLYFLPDKDAARTSALSKTWKSMWSSCPTVRINQGGFSNSSSSFEQFMKRCLQNCVTQNIGLETLSLRILQYVEEWKDVVDQLINFAAKSRTLEKVHIEFWTRSTIPYYGCLPASILSSNSLTSLYLHGCGLKNLDDINFPRLQKLVLRDMDVDETTVYHLMLRFPLLESLSIQGCRHLTSLKVPSILEKLKIFGVSRCTKLARVEVPALTSLKSFAFSGVQSMPCEINLAACKTLKCLLLANIINMSSEWLQNQLSKSVGVERLELFQIINTSETFKISSPKLKRLVFSYCKNLGAETEIDAPRLHEVEYIENKLPYYSLNTTPNYLKKATCRFYFRDLVDPVWFHKLKQLFETTFHIQDLNLAIICYKSKRIIIHDQLSYSLLPLLEGLKDLELHAIISSKNIVDFLVMCRWDSAYLASSNINDSLRVFIEKILEKREETSCCKHLLSKCPAHGFMDVEIESINWEADEESAIANKDIPLL